jgi:penicillin-binding protein 2
MKKRLLPIIIIIVSVSFLIRLFYLQIIDESLKIKSENIAIKVKYEFPERGYMYDRKGKLLVANQPSYDIMVVPNEVKDLDTIEFCNILQINKEEFIKKIKKAEKYSPRLPSLFLAQLNKLEFAAFQEKIRKYNGFYIQKRSLRDYQTKAGANIFGFITQVNDAIIEKKHYYKSGDLIGKQGVEEAYEDILRGVKGVKRVLRDKHNKEIGSFKEGKYDTIAKQGKDITLTIDKELQEYGEQLMVNKWGSIVAIEPSTGEILALVTAPNYDPALLVGRDRSKNYTKLYNDSIAKPLFDRGLLGEFPPGSPFKILTGLIGLQEKVIDQESSFSCRHGFSYARGAFMKCHCAGGSNIKLHYAIHESCNAYFANVYRLTIQKYKKPKDGVDAWSAHLKSFGLGNFMGYDLPPGRKGHIPTSKFYERFYPNGGWRATTIISNSIGQGEVSTTPIQLANFMAAIANQGYYYTPHIIKKIKGTPIDTKYTTKHITTIDKQHFQPIINGMFDVYNLGTASRLRVEGLEICGKTGTAENFTKINGKRVKLEDHSEFVAFAPKANPKIAIAVIVENGHWGNSWAGPIATLMIEKYLNNKITRKDLEKRMLEGNLNYQYRKLYPSKDSLYKPKLTKLDSIRMKLEPKKTKEQLKKEAEEKKAAEAKKKAENAVKKDSTKKVTP